jgi:hypothetical protein
MGPPKRNGDFFEIYPLTTGTALPRTLLRIWPKINTRAAFRI